MNRELLVTLIRKNIDELIMLTEGFMEMNTYPAAIINLAKNKTDDIWSYINQLGNLKPEEIQQVIEKMPVVPEMTTDTGKSETVETEESISNKETTEEEEMHPVQRNDMNDEEKNAFDEETFSEEEDDDDIIFENEQEETKEEEVTESVEKEEVIDDNKDDIEITEDVITAEFTETIEKEETIASDSEKIITTTETAEKKVTLAEKISGNGISRNEMLARGENGGINAAIGSKKVDDIRQAISLGDRFRFQRELFKNNGEEMNKTLSYINKLATYEEVISFLQSKYGWKEGSAAAEDFYQIIKRKF
ncbi:MAG: hypothetical protein PHQ11_03605 [Paludibacter sp.]|nr:hypothetical protein [Paludibacter sp.]MDD4428254.1 hypothetical protein [Paludibacter sp.]